MTNGTASDGVMGDVQRAIALILIGTLAAVAFVIAVRLVINGDLVTLTEISKTLLAALVNMGLIALGFFFGSSKAKEASDAGQQKVLEKLTGTPSPPGPPGPVTPAPQPIIAWWSVLTDAERTALEADAADTRIAAFIAAAKIGKATTDDLSYLVGKGLLTQDRATAIQAI